MDDNSDPFEPDLVMDADNSDPFMDILALRLSSVPFHDLSANRDETEAPVNRSTTNPVTISFVGPLLDPSTPANGNWTTFRSIIPLAGQSEPLALPVVRLVTTVVTGTVPTDGRPAEWLISGDITNIGEELVVVAQSIYPIDPSWGPQTKPSQICATGILGAIVQKQKPSWTGVTSEAKSEERFDDLEWDEASICERTPIRTGEVAWLDVAVGLARRPERDPNHWLEMRHALVSMKCRRPARETQNGDENRVLENLESITIVGQLLGINLETHEFFVQL